MIDTGLPPIGFQPYDEALRDFFTMKVYPDPEDSSIFETLVPVTGPPILNLGTQTELNVTAGPLNTRQNQIVKLPATAVTQLNWTFDLKRWTRAHFRKLGWTEEGNKVIQSPQVIPVDIMYQFDLWSKYRTTMNQMLRNVLLKFVNREVWLNVDLKGVWGVRRIPLTLLYSNPENLTDVTPDDKERTVRMAFSFILHAWAIPDATMLPTVRKHIYDIYYSEHTDTPYPSLTDIPPYPEWVNIGITTVETEIPVDDQNP